MKKFLLGFLAAALLMTGGFFAYTRWIEKGSGKSADQEITKYHCPMHPTYISDRQGDCPICGMRLVPIEKPKPDPHAGNGSEETVMPESQAADSAKHPSVPGYAAVSIPQERIQTMGITVTEARRMELAPTIRTFGRVTYDETRVYHVHTKFDGYIEDLYVNFVGEYVKKGQPLFSIYSPELYATQNEYLLALRAREQMPLLNQGESESGVGRVDLLAAARQRLGLWDIGEDQINALEKTRKPFRALLIHSPISGYVTAKTALQGMRVVHGDNMYDIVDLSRVWVQADIYEMNLPLVKLGQAASLTVSSHPGKIWRGKVTFIDPTVNPATRTVRARLEFANPNGELKPEMYADVLLGGIRGSGIGVPESAVISTGERNIVFVEIGKGVYEPREVQLGIQSANWVEIQKGVSEGERVVTGANFLLDSESKLKAAVSDAGEHQHGS